MTDIIDSHEATRYLGVSRVTVYRNAREGILPAFRIGRVWKFNRTKLKQWVQEQHTCHLSKGAR